MKSNDSARFRACLLALSELYGREVSEAVASIWWKALARFEIDAVEGAFQRHFTNPDVGQYPPKPADIVRMLEGTSLDSSMVAWAKVDKAVRAVGTYASVAFDDALVHRVLHDMGGWIGLGQKTEDEWPFVGNEFRARYHAYRSRQEAPEYPARLVGIAEADNGRKGYAVSEVVLIGDADRARKVVENGTEKAGIGFQRVPATAKVLAMPERRPRALAAPARVPEIVGEAT